ncbi:MAG: hypothetical protein Q7T26_06655 [Dehalococcoidia bacterium]|nr:hypothetical protein [Dehalococcoidia bacterium]
MSHAELLEQGKFHELSELLLFEYLGNNKSLFERDDLNRRVRILETHMRDTYSDRRTSVGARKEDAQTATLTSAQEFLSTLVPNEEMPVEAVPSEAEEDVSVPVFKIRVLRWTPDFGQVVKRES